VGHDGEMKWNPNYPDPQGMIDKLHEEHFHLMVSIWPYFRPGTAVYDEFEKKGWFIDKMKAVNYHRWARRSMTPPIPRRGSSIGGT